jgi:hypothetical protein
MRGIQIKPKVETDKIYGCSMVFPTFLKVKPIIRTTDNVKMDDVYWLITKTAADLAATSPVDFIARNFESFNLDAEKRMKAMKKANRVSQASTPAYGGWSPSGRPDGR